MYSHKYFLDNFDYLVDRLSLRGVTKQNLEEIRDAIMELRGVSDLIGKAIAIKTDLERDARNNIDKIKGQKDLISKLRAQEETLDSEIKERISHLPNVPHDSLTGECIVIRE